MAGKRDIEAGRAFIKLFLKNDLSKQLKGALQGMSKSLKTAGESMKKVGGQMLKVGAAMTAGFGLAVKMAADFDDQMRIVKAVTQATDKQFEMLRMTALNLGRTTSFTASEVAALMTELGRAGFDPTQIDRMTASVLDLAKATGSDATLASGIMAAAIRQFSRQAGDAGRVADALTVAANKSFNTLESLGESLTYAGPVASDFNMSIEDTLALLGALGNVGIQGSNAGTALRRLLTLSGAEAKKLKGIFGVEFADAAGNARPLADVLDEVNEATKNLGTAERAKKFNDAFGLLGITGASAISKNVTSVKALREELAKAEGVAAKTHQEMESGIGGTLRRIMSAAEGVAIAIGNALAPGKIKIGEAIAKNLTLLAEFIEKNKSLVVALSTAAIAITAIGGALVGLGTAATIASAVLSGLASIVGVLFSPLGLIAAALVTGAVLWAKYTESGRRAIAAVGQIFSTAKQALGGIAEALSNGDLARAGDIAFTALKLLALQAWDAIQNAFGDTFGKIIGYLAEGNLTAAFGAVADGLGEMWSGLGKSLEGVWEFAAEHIGALWDTLMVGVLQSMADMTRGVRDMWHATLQEIGKTYLQAQVFLGKMTKDQAKFAELGMDVAFGVLKERGDKVNSPLTSIAQRLEAEAAMRASRSRGPGGPAETSAEIRARLKKRLDALTKTGTPAPTKDDAETPGGKAETPGGKADVGGGATGLRGVQGGIPVTFNAAAAIAAGVQPSRAPEEKMVDHLDNIEKSSKRAAVAAERHYQAMIKFEHAFRYGS